MFSRCALLILASAAVLPACAGGDIGPALGQFGEDEDTVCVEASAEAVGDTDTVSLGEPPVDVVVQDLLDLATGSFVAPLTWEATGEVVEVELVAAAEPGTAERIHYDPASDDIPAVNCPNRLRFTVTGVLSTADGLLDEAIDAPVSSESDSVALDQRVVGLGGTLDPAAYAVGDEPVEDDQIDLHLRLQEGLGPFQGQVAPVLSDDPGGDVVPLGTWPGELEGARVVSAR